MNHGRAAGSEQVYGCHSPGCNRDGATQWSGSMPQGCGVAVLDDQPLAVVDHVPHVASRTTGNGVGSTSLGRPLMGGPLAGRVSGVTPIASDLAAVGNP